MEAQEQRLLVGALAFALAACGGGGDQTRRDLENARSAANLAAMAYRRQVALTPPDAGSPQGALDRGAYCAAENILAEHREELPDSGIHCAR